MAVRYHSTTIKAGTTDAGIRTEHQNYQAWEFHGTRLGERGGSRPGLRRPADSPRQTTPRPGPGGCSERAACLRLGHARTGAWRAPACSSCCRRRVVQSHQAMMTSSSLLDIRFILKTKNIAPPYWCQSQRLATNVQQHFMV